MGRIHSKTLLVAIENAFVTMGWSIQIPGKKEEDNNRQKYAVHAWQTRKHKKKDEK